MEIDAKSPDGNATVIMCYVWRLLMDTGQADKWPDAEKRMKSGNYDNLCKVAEEVTHGSITVVNRDNEGSGGGCDGRQVAVN